MRILFCNKYNFPFSGTEVYLFELAQMLREHSHAVALFAMDDSRASRGPFQSYSAPRVDFKNSASGISSRLRLAAHAIYSRSARNSIRGAIEEFHPDVAHMRNIYHHLSPSILWELKRQGVPVLYHINDFKLLCPNYNLVADGHPCERCSGGKFHNAVLQGCYAGGRAQAAVLAAEAYVHRWLRTYEKCVDQILAPSQFVRNKLESSGWPSDRIRVLPHFQKISQAAPDPSVPNAPILYFGRLSEEKGLFDLLQAMRRLPSIRLNIAGQGPLGSRLEEFVRERGMSNVAFVGHLQGLPLAKLIGDSKFTVLPSHAYETLGKTILESYALSRAVIASDLGSRREFVRHGETGLLYEAGNTTQLIAAIALLHENPELAAAMGSKGREYVMKHHSPVSHLQAITDLYREVVEAKASSRVCKPPYACQSQAPSRPRLRIAFIGGRGVVGKYSGIEGYYEEVGRHLAAAGHEVIVYCRSYFTPKQDRYHGMRLVRLPALRSKHLETVLHTFLSTAHVLFQPCDIVHYHALGPALFALFPRLVGKKTAVTVQGLDWQRKKWGRIASTILRVGEKAAAAFPDSTMVVSRTLDSYFRMHHGVQTHYVPNGAPLRELRQDLLPSWSLKPNGYVLFLGRFSPEKNCHLLIEAFEKIDTDAKLVLAGGSNVMDEYSQEIWRHAGNRIVVLDYVSGQELDALLTNAMLFVLPSDLEGLSLALLEAMGAGICVLASDIPENCELVEGAGYTFRRGDGAGLEQKLNLLISSPDLRERAGRAAQDRIRNHYQWASIAASIEEIYYGMLGWPNSSGRDSSVKLGTHRTSCKRAA